MQQPQISVIIPLYNKENSISNTIQSVLSQTYSDFELVIVDDGSTDNSLQVVNSISDDRIKVLHKYNGGVSTARNYGLDVAVNDWILFLDADDMLDENCLSVLCSSLEKEEGIGVSTANFYIEKHGSKVLSTKYHFSGIVPDNYKWLFLNRYNLRTGCCIIRRDILLKTKFDETLSRFEDMKSILEWIRDVRVYVSDVPVMTYKTDNSFLSRVSKDISKDFIFNMSFDKKSFWEKCILGRLLYLGWIGYKQEHHTFRKMYGKNLIYMYIAKCQLLLSHF